MRKNKTLLQKALSIETRRVTPVKEKLSELDQQAELFMALMREEITMLQAHKALGLKGQRGQIYARAYQVFKKLAQDSRLLIMSE